MRLRPAPATPSQHADTDPGAHQRLDHLDVVGAAGRLHGHAGGGLELLDLRVARRRDEAERDLDGGADLHVARGERGSSRTTGLGLRWCMRSWRAGASMRTTCPEEEAKGRCPLNPARTSSPGPANLQMGSGVKTPAGPGRALAWPTREPRHEAREHRSYRERQPCGSRRIAIDAWPTSRTTTPSAAHAAAVTDRSEAASSAGRARSARETRRYRIHDRRTADECRQRAAERGQAGRHGAVHSRMVSCRRDRANAHTMEGATGQRVGRHRERACAIALGTMLLGTIPLGRIQDHAPPDVAGRVPMNCPA